MLVRDGLSFSSAILRGPYDDFGLQSLDLLHPIRRMVPQQLASTVPLVEAGVDERRIRPRPGPVQLLGELPEGDNVQAQSRRAVARLRAYFLCCEDPQRRLEAREVETLAHQVSLVRHINASHHLQRVLIADEVGLGKTIEAGLILGELIDQRPGIRILYLAPARLVSNVRREFDKLKLGFRQWTASDADARLDDPRIIASIHKAVHGKNADHLLATAPWDVIVVDECHHLSAWGENGSDPREAYKLVRDLVATQREDGRLILLSGTPHQGSPVRFENLLKLLRGKDEGTVSLEGRVIYRTKDDVQDWSGAPLFPARQVNPPLVVDLGAGYRQWIQNIHRHYRPGPDAERSEARRRAAGWRCAQALQWAASSPQAGMGYLVRQAMRAGMTASDEIVRQTLAAIRPYRGGKHDEDIDALFARIQKEITRQIDDADVEDIEDEVGDADDRRGLTALLTEGLELLHEGGDLKWRYLQDRLLSGIGDEKVVLFAQPIETVCALAEFLRRETGRDPAVIIGGQSDAERQAIIQKFRATDGPQFLVSSRAGGEGINLQVARRLVHLDIPWNPMELEQRVGRVHRFGSQRTILVDSLIVKDSREADAYRIAREKLRRITATMVESERFESVFGRVMCLMPPEDLQEVLLSESTPTFNSGDEETLAQLVQAGFSRWQQFHTQYGQERQRIRELDAGVATPDDLAAFAVDHAGGRAADGFHAHRFRRDGSEVVAVQEPATVISLPGDKYFSIGDAEAVTFSSTTGPLTGRLGTNTPEVVGALFKCAFPELPTGAAHLRWKGELPAPFQEKLADRFGIIAIVRQSVRRDAGSGWLEHGSTLHCYIVAENGADPEPLSSNVSGAILRGLWDASIRAKADRPPQLIERLALLESELTRALRQPSEADLETGIRHAAYPVFAAVVTTKDD